MFLRVGAISLALLLLSRLLGLARESVLAAAFGGTGMADVAVLVLTLPDWIVGVAVSGALSYVLVPAWAGVEATAVAQLQRKAAIFLFLGGVIGALTLVVFQGQVLSLAAPGLAEPWRGMAFSGLIWSALAFPLALIAALWSTRLQHERDFLGYYGANLWVNGTLIVFIALAGLSLDASRSLLWLGTGLLLAMGLRLTWQLWRIHRASAAKPATEAPTLATLPKASLWVWASLSAGFPLAMPFIARSLASGQGEGALAAFHYAWKLVELPLMLAIQLVATLAFPGVAAAVVEGLKSERCLAPVRRAFVLAWTLACMATAGLLVGSDALTRLLFGWGRMDQETLVHVAHLSRVAAWGLLPQALSAVALTVLAAQGRMKPAAIVYGMAVALLSLGAAASAHEGRTLMMALNVLFTGVSAGLLVAIGRSCINCLPLRVMALPLSALVLVALVCPWLARLTEARWGWELLAAVVAAALVAGVSWTGAQGLGQMLRR